LKGFIIVSLDKMHDRKSFVCGIDSLDNYLRKQAGQESQKRIAVTYMFNDQNENKIAGYYTLSATAIELMALPEAVRKKLPPYPYLPATLIGRLAVDKVYKRRGFGELILIDAMKRAYRTSLEVASLAIVVDAINSNAKQFYEKYGFLDLSVASHRLFFPMNMVSEL